MQEVTRTKDLQSQIERVHPAFHMQFHKGSMHKSQALEWISPDHIKGEVMAQTYQTLVG